MALRHDLLAFIRDNLLSGDASGLDENAALIDRGIVDSMGLTQILGFLEDRTGVRIPDHEVVRDNFQTVGRIESLVTRLQGAR